MTNIRESATQKDLLRNTHFEPVFDSDGNIEGIRELKVATDRRGGMEAMRELVATQDAGDDIVGADGWTGKQRRILRQKSPMAAHYLKPSQKWDAKTGTMRDGVLIQLPYEVVWTLFELLFEGQYSLKVSDFEFESQEVEPRGTDHKGQKADDAPGTLFYARATVEITIHLANGQAPRVYHGVGVSYGDVPIEKTGNIFALNNARRTAEKGAVADAKREALTHIGPVFRRAFEDGDDMIDHVEKLLLEEIRERNKPAIHKTAKHKDVPPPARKSKEAPDSDKKEAEAGSTSAPSSGKITVTLPGAPDRLVDDANLSGTLIDILFETCANRAQAKALIDQNSYLVERLEDRSEIDEIIASFEDEDADSIPDFDLPDSKQEAESADADTDVTVIDPTGKSGKAVLDALSGLLKAAGTKAERDSIIEANGSAMRKLTPKQMSKLTALHTNQDT